MTISCYITCKRQFLYRKKFLLSEYILLIIDFINMITKIIKRNKPYIFYRFLRTEKIYFSANLGTNGLCLECLFWYTPIWCETLKVAWFLMCVKFWTKHEFLSSKHLFKKRTGSCFVRHKCAWKLLCFIVVIILKTTANTFSINLRKMLMKMNPRR